MTEQKSSKKKSAAEGAAIAAKGAKGAVRTLISAGDGLRKVTADMVANIPGLKGNQDVLMVFAIYSVVLQVVNLIRYEAYLSTAALNLLPIIVFGSLALLKKFELGEKGEKDGSDEAK